MDDLQTLVGLVGVALVIAVGGLLDDVRDWLMGFAVPLNPLRMLGIIMSSTMIVGFCVGAVYAVQTGRDVALTGGVVALASAVSDEGLALLHGIVRRLMGGASRGAPPQGIPQIMEEPVGKGIETDEGNVPTEDDVHAKMDAEEAEEVRALTG